VRTEDRQYNGQKKKGQKDRQYNGQKKKEQKDRQWLTLHYTEYLRLSIE